MGVAGAAIATVIAQGISAVLSLMIFLRLLKTYENDEKYAVFDRKMLKTGTKIAIPSIVQQSIVSIGMLLTQSSVNYFGSSALAGYSAGSRLESLGIVPMIATGNAMSPFTAQNLDFGYSAKRNVNPAVAVFGYGERLWLDGIPHIQEMSGVLIAIILIQEEGNERHTVPNVKTPKPCLHRQCLSRK